jgi:hypothetical protein
MFDCPAHNDNLHQQRYGDLVDLYKGKGMHQEALGLLKE